MNLSALVVFSHVFKLSLSSVFNFTRRQLIRACCWTQHWACVDIKPTFRAAVDTSSRQQKRDTTITWSMARKEWKISGSACGEVQARIHFRTAYVNKWFEFCDCRKRRLSQLCASSSLHTLTYHILWITSKLSIAKTCNHCRKPQDGQNAETYSIIFK